MGDANFSVLWFMELDRVCIRDRGVTMWYKFPGEAFIQIIKIIIR